MGRRLRGSLVFRLRSIARRLVTTIGGRTLLGLVALLIAYQVWIGVTAPGKIAEGVGDNPDEFGRFNVDVVLGFEPERFHILLFQDYGRIRGTDGNVVHLRLVTQDGVDELARKYWIDEIRPAEESISILDL